MIVGAAAAKRGLTLPLLVDGVIIVALDYLP